MYCIETISEIIMLLEDYNTKNQKFKHKEFIPSNNIDYKIMFEGVSAHTFSNCSIKTYDYSSNYWRNICSYVRSADKRKSKVQGTFGFRHVTIQPISEKTEKIARSFILVKNDDIDSQDLEITPEYDDHENIESFLFQRSVLSNLEYNMALKIYLINYISPKLRFGEVSMYDLLYEKSEEELQIILNILKEGLDE